MVAFGILDYRKPTFEDPYGRPLEEFFTIEATLETFRDGNSTFTPIGVHKCTEGDLAKFYPPKEMDERPWAIV